MTVRTGMATLIAELRRRTDESGTVDWSDQQLQDTLDRHRRAIRREALCVESETSGGSAVYHDYRWFGGHWVEEAASGTAIWRVEDAAGSAVGTADYVPEYGAQTLRFTANTGGAAYYLHYRVYDLNRAAADVWDDKAASVAARFDVKTDNHELKRDQLYQHYRDMAATFRRRAGAQVATRVRADVNGGEGWDA